MVLLESLALLAVAFVPGFIWLWFYYTKDIHPEPARPVLQVFFLGMLITIPVIFVELGVDYFVKYSSFTTLLPLLASTFLIVAPIEEIAKYIVVKRTVFFKKVFDEPIDGVIYCVAASLGFATLENILAALSEGGSIIILRAVTATVLHALAGGFVGFHMGIAKFKPAQSKKYLFQGLIVAIIFHGIYNFIISADTDYTFPLLFILLGIMYICLAMGINKLKVYQLEQDAMKTLRKEAQNSFDNRNFLK